MLPSLSDYATNERSLYPQLWTDCVFALAPGLGCTGGKLWEHARNTFAIPTAYAFDRWNPSSSNAALDAVPGPIPSYGFVEGTNGSAFWGTLEFDVNLFSVSIWVCSAGQAATSNCVFSIGSTGLTLRLLSLSTGAYTANWSNSTIATTSTTTATTDVWTHIVAQRSRGNGNRTELWVNGVLEATSTATLSLANKAVGLNVGARRDTGVVVNTWGGALDDMRIYNRMLSREDINLLYGQRLSAYIPKRWILNSFAPSQDEITGSASVTLDAATSSASGLQTITGSASASTDSSVSSASGQVEVVGSASTALSDSSSAASGSVAVIGTASSVTGDSTCSSAGIVSVSGAASATTHDATSSAVGGSGFFGSASVQLDQSVSQCAAVVSSVGSGAASTDCQCGSSGLVTDVGSSSATTDDSLASASAFVGFIGSGSSTTDSSGVASGVVSVIAVGLATTADSTSQATGGIPTQGSVAVTLESAYCISAGVITEIDVVLDASVELTELAGGISVPSLQGRVRYDVLEGRKIWP